MTVSSQDSNETYDGNGVTTIWPLPFRFFSDTDIFVYLVDPALPMTTPLVIGTDYTLTGAGLPEQFGIAPGNITTTVPVPIGKHLYVERIMDAEQLTDIVNQGRFFPEVHEDVFDRLTMLIQQQNGELSRAIRVPNTDPEPARLPSAASRASQLMGFDAIGNPIVVAPATGSAEDLALDLANAIDPNKGAEKIGIQRFATSQPSTVSRILKRNAPANVLDYMTEAEVADVMTLAPVLDHTAAFQSALNNHVVVLVPPFTYNVSALTMNKMGHSLVGQEGSGSKAYSGGAVLKGSLSTSPIITVSMPTTYFEGLVFWGLSNDTEKGEDVTQTGIRMVGSSQKDLDAKIHNCGFVYLTSGVVANGTNVEFDSTIFSNCRYGFESSNAAGWENRGFTFSDTCRFHSIGKTGVASAAVKLWPAHNVRDVTIAGLADDTTTVVNGMASGLVIKVGESVRSRGTGIVLDATGHGQPAEFRAVDVSGFSYYATAATNTSAANSGITAVGLMRLTLDDVTVHGSGGHGVVNQVAGAVLRGIHASDAGQFANNTYDGVIVTGSGCFLSGVSTSQDVHGFTATNKARYGINLQGTPTYIGSISPGLNTISGPLNIVSTVTIYGETPSVGGPANAITWGSAMPTSGTRRLGDIHHNTNPIVAGAAASQYVVAGWKRLTTGTAHVLGTDWVAMRTLTGT